MLNRIFIREFYYNQILGTIIFMKSFNATERKSCKQSYNSKVSVAAFSSGVLGTVLWIELEKCSVCTNISKAKVAKRGYTGKTFS